MKDEHRILARKMFDLKLSGRSRSQRVVQDVFVPVDAFKQNCWANMPPELLRDVLMRIESSDSDWPSRKNVIACAGVCKSWREITKEIVKLPEVSGKLTFPISVKQPGPRESLVQCFINRDRSRDGDTYHLYLGANYASDGKFLLAARKCRNITSVDYNISLNADYISKGSNAIVGKLRANLLGTKFVVYDAQPPSGGPVVTKSRSTRLASLKQVSPRVPSCNYHAAHISYELHVMGARGPRRMQCVMDAIPISSVQPGGSAPTQTEFYPSSSKSGMSLPFFRSKSTNTENFQSGPIPASTEGKLVLKNKSPRWLEQLQCWCLNFHGRVTRASVKNFQLVAASETGPENETVILQFGKVNHDVFIMDYQYPLSAFQAFAICLSSFETRTACE